MKKLFAIAFVFICSIFSISAQERLDEKEERVIVSKSDTLNIYFRQASSKWDPQLYNNQASLQNFLNLYRQLREYSGLYRIKDIQIIAGCSPEGLYDYNRVLSRNRAKCIRNVIETYVDLPDSLVTERAIGIDWEGLRDMAENDPDLPLKKEALDIIDNSPELHVDESGKRMELRKVRLMWRYDGKIWEYMYEHYFPYLRCFNLSIVIKYDKIADVDDKDFLVDFADIEPIEHKLAYRKADNISVPEVIDLEKEKNFYCAVKTNLLCDAVAALNFSLEIPFNEKFSILYEHHCPWWLSKNNKYCLQFLSFGGEFRWWFAPRTKTETVRKYQREVLTGHFLGVYGWTGKSDIQIENKLGCYQFDFCSTGLTYGYSMPIGKHLNMEFSISAGYAQIPYQHYIPTDDYSILIRDDNNAGTLHYFGPTKAEISLVIPIRAKIKGGRK